ncbi:hypothetical protein [Aliiglaciecola litoralis]|uniref:Uncharacterized protein n=1 Tax=Aliiglaciecola litoralis TaxID=582857 RepID=A0ABP3X238_9ALTE
MVYNRNSIATLFGALLGLLIIGYYGLTIVYPELGRTHPERSILEQFNGTIEWIKETGAGRGEDSIRFKFNEFDKYFVYHSTEIRLVKDRLEIPNSNVEILVDLSDSHSPPIDEHSYHTVYEVISNHVNVRSYEQVKNAYTSDFKSVLWSGLGLFVFSALVLLYENSKYRKKHKN